MLHDVLEESWVYQEIKKKGLEQGLEQGLQQGLERGLERGIQQGRDEVEARIRELRQQRKTLIAFLETHFPAMVPLVKVQTYDIDDPEVLQNLLIDLFHARSDEEAERTISSLPEQQL